ncbi:hypothetical protein GYMLUDRAFT_877900 [Collybiopsis luxurians FD-317 M1]|nr:hypothetical protein GYMLUDRAFT_877900 [Collybiopsis luxurians FD-317 M1]
MVHCCIAALGISLAISMVNAGIPLQPRIKSTKQGTAIRGLLGQRQSTCPSGYGICDDSDFCCPLGGQCCDDSTGGCCDTGQYCTIGTNDLGGCCPDGELCSGPGPGGGGITSIEPTSFSFTPFSTPFTTSAFTGSLTFFAPQSTPTAGPGFTNVFVPGDTPQFTWSSTDDWIDSSSSCDVTKQTRKATEDFAYFVYSANSNSSGASVYLDISYESIDFDIYINDAQLSTESSDIGQCTFFPLGVLPNNGDDLNIGIFLNGPPSGARRQVGSDSWSFEFNGFVYVVVSLV